MVINLGDSTWVGSSMTSVTISCWLLTTEKSCWMILQILMLILCFWNVISSCFKSDCLLLFSGSCSMSFMLSFWKSLHFPRFFMANSPGPARDYSRVTGAFDRLVKAEDVQMKPGIQSCFPNGKSTRAGEARMGMFQSQVFSMKWGATSWVSQTHDSLCRLQFWRDKRSTNRLNMDFLWSHEASYGFRYCINHHTSTI